jgi:serine/threonine-protein kinase HipA
MTAEKLICISNGKRVGELVYKAKEDRVQFEYESSWLQSDENHPISLSLPLSNFKYSGHKVTNFLWGLLPDSPRTLERWGKLHHVSHNNVFRLLWHYGKDCAGNIQFIQPEKVSEFEKPLSRADYDRLSKKQLDVILKNLVIAEKSNAPAGYPDEGKFSLAGAQPKVALYFDEDTNVWGKPTGNTASTHILKPQASSYNDFAINEHFCNTLARKVGLLVTKSFVIQAGRIPTIVVERYDRLMVNGILRRIHQEDICQALGLHPNQRYENWNGPTAIDVFKLIENSSSSADRDMRTFFNALVFNWIISGPDAHAKNYSLLIGINNEVRLAPLYDLATNLYYQDTTHIRKQKLAMKIGGEYLVWKIRKRQWEKLISEIPKEAEVSMRAVYLLINDVEEKLTVTVGELVGQGLKKSAVQKMGRVIRARCKELKTEFYSEDRIKS